MPLHVPRYWLLLSDQDFVHKEMEHTFQFFQIFCGNSGFLIKNRINHTGAVKQMGNDNPVSSSHHSWLYNTFHAKSFTPSMPVVCVAG